LVIDTSADVITAEIVDDVLSAVVASVDVVVIVAVFVIVAPFGRFAPALNTSTKVSAVPFVTVGAVQVTVPPPNAQLNAAGPDALLALTNVIPGGTESLTVTLWASFGPASMIVIVYVTLVPAVTDAGPVFVIDTSAGGLTTVLAAEAVLLPSVGSFVVDDTRAEFVKTVPLVAAAGIWITSTKVSMEIAPTLAAKQVTTPALCAQVKPSGLVATLTETKLVVGGIVSDTVTFCAGFGPLLIIVIVYVAFVPDMTDAGPTFVIARSADGVIAVVVAVDELLAGFPSAVAEITFAVFDIIVLFGTLPICRTSTKVSTSPFTTVGALQVSTATATPQLKAPAPDEWLADTKLVPAGKVSLTETVDALFGPLLMMVMV
jgi:hypothetical protein